MPERTFVAFSSADTVLSELIDTACEHAQTSKRILEPWNRLDPSGTPIDKTVYSWIEDADSLIADVSEPNDNVTYEIGLALGLRKPLRLIRASNKALKNIVSVGLLHNVGHDEYTNTASLAAILKKPILPNDWPKSSPNREHPVYFLQLTGDEDISRRVASHIKKIIKLKYRSMNPNEVDRLTASEAFEHISQSFGIIAVWDNSEAVHSTRQNQRTSFAIGVARGLDIPFLLLAHKDDRLPLDLDEIATRWEHIAGLSSIMRRFRDEIYEYQEAFVEIKPNTERFLDRVYCGDPAAENEASQLETYFLETEQFRLTASGDLNILLGRKGSGKTAIFLQTRNRTRAEKSNIVVDLQPEGYQLIRLKEFVLEYLSIGARKEFIASFWEYIVWLEIAYKILEKDHRRARYDFELMERYRQLEEFYQERAEGEGDFSERLQALVERIIVRYEGQSGWQEGSLASSRVLEIVYGKEITEIREEVLGYLSRKGMVFFLFDNLDRFWTPPSFTELDAEIISGLIESLKDIRRRFSRRQLEFSWAIFLRSDVFEFVIGAMADYGKLSVASVEWNDRALLERLFKNRILGGLRAGKRRWGEVWEQVSVQRVDGRQTLEFLVESSLMRPRYLIRLFETARRRAVTLGRNTVQEEDYRLALQELGWQVLEDFDRELKDVVPAAEDLMFDLLQLGTEFSLKRLCQAVGARARARDVVDTVVDVLIWTGCIGVKNGGGVTYISDCGFRRAYIRSLLRDEDAEVIVFHPTLAAVIGGPTT